MAVTSRCTDYACSEGHEWYSYSIAPATRCPYPRMGQEVFDFGGAA